MKKVLVCVLLAAGVLNGFGQEGRKSKEAILATAKKAVTNSNQVKANVNAAFSQAMEMNQKQLAVKKAATALAITQQKNNIDSLRIANRLRPEEVFISQYGVGYAGLAEVTPEASSSYHEFLTPIAYVDLNHVTDQLESFLQAEFGFKTNAGSSSFKDDQYKVQYVTGFEDQVLTFTYNVGTYGNLFYAKDCVITGSSDALLHLYVYYWHTPFYMEEQGQDDFFTTNYKLDKIQLATDLSGITVSSKALSDREFSDLLDEYR